MRPLFSPSPFFVLALALTLLSLTACSPPGPSEGSIAPGELKVVATTGMIGDLAAQLVGDLGTVTTLMGPGVDPHLYKALESDVRTLSEADLILYNGLYLEGKMGDVLVKLARTRPVVAVSERVGEDRLREPPELEGAYDPHIWFDVSLWLEAVAPVEAALVELLPGESQLIGQRADELRERLRAMDQWVEGQIATIPEEHRVMITAHDAFGYFGDRYNIEVVGIQGISTASEAGLADVERVVDLIVERRVPAVFIESSVPRRAIEAVQAAARARGHEVRIGGELFSDAMGAVGTPQGTYNGMVRHNVETVVKALVGDLDEAAADSVVTAEEGTP
ncbi:MAG: zinc ABC transporter substrate-binding protein [Acidobacteriota bacterium]